MADDCLVMTTGPGEPAVVRVVRTGSGVPEAAARAAELLLAAEVRRADRFACGPPVAAQGDGPGYQMAEPPGGFAARPAARNGPCPCGCGRKAKRCKGGRR